MRTAFMQNPRRSSYHNRNREWSLTPKSPGVMIRGFCFPRSFMQLLGSQFRVPFGLQRRGLGEYLGEIARLAILPRTFVVGVAGDERKGHCDLSVNHLLFGEIDFPPRNWLPSAL